MSACPRLFFMFEFMMISEKKKLLTVVRSSLGAVMDAEGYGRGKKNAGEGKGKLSYKTGTPPAWWNIACESIVPWNMFGGVNKPKEWKGTWSGLQKRVELSNTRQSKLEPS